MCKLQLGYEHKTKNSYRGLSPMVLAIRIRLLLSLFFFRWLDTQQLAPVKLPQRPLYFQSSRIRWLAIRVLSLVACFFFFFCSLETHHLSLVKLVQRPLYFQSNTIGCLAIRTFLWSLTRTYSLIHSGAAAPTDKSSHHGIRVVFSQ